MTREQATAEAQRRNVIRYRQVGDLDRIWVEVEVAPGQWDVELREHLPPPLWQRLAYEALDLAAPSAAEMLPPLRRRVWRVRRRRAA